jgi:hypothetical protein
MAVEKILESLSQQDKDLEHEMRLSIYRLSLAKCRDFATTVHARFPTELRNLVYLFAWTHKRIKMVSANWRDAVMLTSDKPPWVRDRDDAMYQSFRWSTLWALPHFVGRQVAQEAAAVYYRQLPGNLVEARNIRYLPRFLKRDHLFTGVTPGDHIRSLDFCFKPPYSRAICEASDTAKLSSRGLVVLRKSFAALRNLKSKEGFELKVSFTDYRPRSDQMDNVRAVLWPLFCELQEAGVRVKFWTGHESTGLVGGPVPAAPNLPLLPPIESEEDSESGDCSSGSSDETESQFVFRGRASMLEA